MRKISRRSVVRHDGFFDALRIAQPNHYPRFGLLRLRRAPALLVASAVVTLIISVSAYLVFRTGASSSSPDVVDKDSIAKTFADVDKSTAELDVAINWTALEPPFRSYKIQVGNDNSLLTEQQTIQLYGIKIIPRGQICSYRSGERWACGQRAYVALLNIFGGGSVDCAPKRTDQLHTLICRLGGRDIAELMLREGWAILSAGTSDQMLLGAAAMAARTNSGMFRLDPVKR